MNTECGCILKNNVIELCEYHTAWEVYGDYEGKVEEICNKLLGEKE